MPEITKEQIEEWKKKYGRVRKLSVNEIDYYYRSLDLDEYYSVQEVANATEGNSDAVGQEQVIRLGVLSPVLAEKIPAGVTIKLSDEILRLSGFVSDEIKPEEL